MKASTTALSAALLGIAVISTPTSAATRYRVQWDQGGPACQLSVPTTASQVRPRATGMRNEGTGSEFVICQYPSTSSAFGSAYLYIQSIDGANHAVQCTGMRGGAINEDARYSTKSEQTQTGSYGELSWFPIDFGATGDFGSSMFSVTCVLPPGASIIAIEADYSEDVGS